MYCCSCVKCNHKFYHLKTECCAQSYIFCPVCDGVVDVEEIKKPVGKNWGVCSKSNTSCCDCKKKS